MGWWKNLQDMLHPPPPRLQRARSGGDDIEQLLASSGSPATPKSRRRRALSSATRYKTFLRLRSRLLSRLLVLLVAVAFIPIVILMLNAGGGGGGGGQSIPMFQKEIAVKHHPAMMSTWERFPFLEKYYGGLATLVRWEKNIPEFDDREESTEGEAQQVAQGAPEFGVVEKEGWVVFPRGKEEEEDGRVRCTLEDGTMPKVYAWPGVPMGMPGPVLGSHEAIGTDAKVCFDRRGRYGDYGLGRNGTGGVGSAEGEEEDEAYQNREGAIDYSKVDWGKLQEKCWEKNTHRFAGEKQKDGKTPASLSAVKQGEDETGTTKATTKATDTGLLSRRSGKTPPRTAIILRTWIDYKFKPSDILNLRALAAEISLHSSGEYQLHILMHVRDPSIPFYASPAVTRETIESSTLPKEFHGLVTLWHEDMMRMLYSAIKSDYIANPPEALHFRRLPIHGVYRSTFMPVQIFAQQHPEYDFFWHWEMDIRYTGHYHHLFDSLDKFARKSPGHDQVNRRFYIPLIHGSYANFLRLHTPQTDLAKSRSPDRTGEDADLITLNPVFNPLNSTWILRDDVTGFNDTLPRRTAIVTASRLSRRLLNSMHDHAVRGRTMFSEMLPPSVAFQEKMKIVYAPHPVYLDRKWPVEAVHAVFGGMDGELWGAYEERWISATWFYNAAWAGGVFRRWMGVEQKDVQVKMGRMCLPGGWLIHPVK